MKKIIFMFFIVFTGTVAHAGNFSFANDTGNPFYNEIKKEHPEVSFESMMHFSFTKKEFPKISGVFNSEKYTVVGNLSGNESSDTGFSGIISVFKTGLSIWDSAENNNNPRSFSEHANKMRLSVGKTIHGVGVKFKF